MTKATTTETLADPAATMSAMMADPGFKALLGSLVETQGAAIAATQAAENAATIEALKAELAATKKATKKAPKKAGKALPPVVFVERAVKMIKGSKPPVPITGPGAGMWPAQIGILPAKYAGKQTRHDYVNIEKIRTVVDNLAACKKIIAQCDGANAAE